MTMSMVEPEKRDDLISTVHQVCVVDLDPGCCSLGTEGSNACRIEATPRLLFFFFKLSIELVIWGGTKVTCER